MLTILFGLTSIWVKKDSLRYGIGSKKWTRIVVVPYALGAVAIAVSVGLNWTEYAFLESGGLWGALGGLSAVWLIPVFLYFIARSRALNDTGEVEAAPPDVVLIATCREVPEENTLLVEKLSENSEFADLVRVLAEAFATRAPVVLFDLAQGGLHVRYDIDGTKVPTRIREHLLNGRKLRKNDPEVWIDAPPLDAVTGEKVLVTLMRLAGLSPKKRGRPQVGEFEVTVDGKKRTCRLTAKVIKGHEQFAVDLAEPPKKFKAADALGMPSEMLDSLQDLVNKKHGLFIVSASKGNGLTTLFDMTVTAGDRLMRDFVSIEEKKKKMKKSKTSRYKSMMQNQVRVRFRRLRGPCSHIRVDSLLVTYVIQPLQRSWLSERSKTRWLLSVFLLKTVLMRYLRLLILVFRRVISRNVLLGQSLKS